MKDCLKKRFGFQQTRTVYDKNEWKGFVRANALGVARKMNLYFDKMPQLWTARAI